MDWIPILIALVTGFIIGIIVSFILKFIQTKSAKELAAELFKENENQRKESVDSFVNSIKSIFGDLSFDALQKSTDEFLKLAKTKLESEREVNKQELDEKKGLIDQQLKNMTTVLETTTNVVKELEKDREKKFGELDNQLKNTNLNTAVLTQTTQSLREALASTKARGQWGKRMAEDVLRLAGLIENVNYLKQKAIEQINSRPDFTFLLPKNLKLNMDVKFPLDNYKKFLEADSETDKQKHQKDFLKDVKSRIKEVTTRDYINPEQNTVDYVLLFIPNEQIYSFIHEQGSSILDEGLKNKVIFCSPITLFAVLAVIRQAVDNFALEKTSNEILSLLGKFKKQWGMFIESFEKLGKKISEAQKEYDSLTTIRKRMLEIPLNEIEELRVRREMR